MDQVLNRLLLKLDLHPVLLDIGASGSQSRTWDGIATQSIYVGFDPDLRDLHEMAEGTFLKSFIVNKAVTATENGDRILFYLTRSPHCSSTLEPDTQALSAFLFSDLFEVEHKALVQAATLDSMMSQLGLDRIHWFKTDSQGTDLRLFCSLPDHVRSRVLAVDVEPGLIDAYVGEDLFVDVHQYMVRNGFWLSNLKVEGTVRMRQSTLSHGAAQNGRINRALVERAVRRSPAWCEARYLRTIESLPQDDAAKEDWMLLWVFAMLDRQLGFALDIALEYERLFGVDDPLSAMKNVPVLRMIRAGYGRKLLAALRALLPSRVRQWLKRYIA